MHNLQLTEDQEMIVDTVRKLVADVVAPTALERDEHRTFARAEFDGLAELGVFGLAVAEDNGGAGMGVVPLIASLEAIGEHSSSLARLFLSQVQCAFALEAAGHDALEGVMMGSALATFVGAEHGFELAGEHVTGAAEFVSGAGEADHLIVAAQAGDEPVLLMCDAAATERESLRSLGLASSAPARVRCDSVPVTVLARGDTARSAIDRAATVGHLGVAAIAIGGGVASIEAGRRHAGERIAFGKPLLRQHAVVRKLVDSQQRVDASRHLCWHAARLIDLGEDGSNAARQARINAVDALVYAADEGIQILGGYGYTVEYHVERHYRDGKTLEVLDGGSERLRDELGAALAT